MLKKAILFGLLFVGFTGLGFFALEKTEDIAKSELSSELDRVGTSMYVSYLREQRHNLERFQCNGRPLYEIVENERRRMGLPPATLYLIFRESGRSANPYAVGCDECIGSSYCFKRGGTSSPNNKNLGKEWLSAFHRHGLYKYCLCPAFRNNPALASERICSVGFGLMQITTTSLQKYTGSIISPSSLVNSKIHATNGGRVNLELVSQEPSQSPFNPCTNVYVGLLILQEKAKSCGNRPVCTICRYSGRAMGMRELANIIVEDLRRAGLNPQFSFAAKLGFVYSDVKQFLIDFANRIRGIPNMAVCPTDY
ncbi:MAG: hypothetical protein QXD20_09695 [Ignisphaera sp.]